MYKCSIYYIMSVDTVFKLKAALDKYNTYLVLSRKFKRGICCGGHLAVTYGGELLYLRIFS